MYPWSASAPLQKIYQSLEEQRRVIDQLKAYLDERLVPFQYHVGEHHRNVDQALRHLESRLKPLRQYVQGEHQNLERMTVHLNGTLREQFEPFEQLLTRQNDILEEAGRYIEEQPRPLHKYLEDERQAIEIIYHDLVEQRLNRLLRIFSEQQEIIESFRAPEVVSEYELLGEYLDERRKAFERYVRTADFRPAEFFAELEEIAERYKPEGPGHGVLFAKLFAKTRLADEKLREALSVPPPARPKQPKKRRTVQVVPLLQEEVEVSLNGDYAVAT